MNKMEGGSIDHLLACIGDLKNKVYRYIGAQGDVTEYELLKHFASHEVFVFCVKEGNAALFQKHFLMMHVLYSLKSIFLESRRYLDISLSRMSLKDLHDDSTRKALSLDADDTKLSEYYSDIRNLYAEDEDSIDAMLSGFWKKYAEYSEARSHDYLSALAVFDLYEGYTEHDLKKRWRELANSEHPDRGGSAERFITLQDAYRCLKAYIKN